MIKEKNPLLKLQFVKKRSSFSKFYNNYSELFYELYSILLDNSIGNLWTECSYILFGYIQLIAHIFDPTVSIIKML
jgi:hypothetical protein